MSAWSTSATHVGLRGGLHFLRLSLGIWVGSLNFATLISVLSGDLQAFLLLGLFWGEVLLLLSRFGISRRLRNAGDTLLRVLALRCLTVCKLPVVCLSLIFSGFGDAIGFHRLGVLRCIAVVGRVIFTITVTTGASILVFHRDDFQVLV